MKIIGITITHDASVCYVEDGVLKYAISEERLSRIKNHAGFPYLALEKMIKDMNIKKDEIDIIAIPERRNQRNSFANIEIFFQRDIKKIKGISNEICLRYRLIYLKNFIYENILGLKKDNYQWMVNFFKEYGFKKARVIFYDHHLCHAASAYYASDYKEALIITQDGGGDGKYGGVYYGKDGNIEVLHENFYTQKSSVSLANIYAAVTKICGFKRNRHEGKITGLAAYGKNFINVFSEIIGLKNLEFYDKKNWHENKWIKYGRLIFTGRPYRMKFYKYLEKAIKKEKKEDIAYSVQKLVEDMMIEYVRNANKLKKSENICLAGGLFANVKINHRIADLDFVKNIFIFPNMGDGGLSVGAAYIAAKENNDEIKNGRLNMYLGNQESKDSINKILEKYKGKIRHRKSDNWIKEIAKMIYEGKVVGFFRGRMEFGPRALCNRSILVRASDKSINNVLNGRLRRTEFMPFAPVIIEEDIDEYFYNIDEKRKAMRFMTITLDVKEDVVSKIPAVVHVDNTARPQTVSREDNHPVYDILKEYKKMSGVSTFINTSFNIHEEPIVSGAEDAIRSMLQNCVDIVCFEDIFVEPEHAE